MPLDEADTRPQTEDEMMDDEEDEEEEEEEEEEEDGEDEEEGDDEVDATLDLKKTSLPAKAVKQVKKVPSKKPLGATGGSKTSLRKRLNLLLAPSAIRRRLVQERFAPQTSLSSGVFLSAALEAFMRELFDAAMCAAQKRKGTKTGKTKIGVIDIQEAVKTDEEFANIFTNVMFATHSVNSLMKINEAPTKNSAAMNNRKKAKANAERGDDKED